MKTASILIVTLIFSINSFSQEYAFWGDLTGGQYAVGYNDTIVYNKRQVYSFLQYTGDKPYFISMWYPITTSIESSRMLYEDYFNFDDPEELTVVRDSLIQMQKSSLMEYGIKNRLGAREETDLSKSHVEVFNKILKTKVNAIATNKLPKGKYPVIIYHHGMGATHSDNAVLFEYLASHGYVVISSNYHWPNQGMPKVDELQNDIRFVIDFTYRLPYINQNKINYLGHSWGAQMGLILNQQGKHSIKNFFLLDTTLEQLPLRLVGRYYPELDSIMRNYAHDFRTPTCVITSRKAYVEDGKYTIQPEPQFEAFKMLNLEHFNILVAKKPLNHEAFTSTGVLRGAYLKEFSQSDSSTLETQFRTYVKLNKQLLKLLESDQSEVSSFFIKKELK